MIKSRYILAMWVLFYISSCSVIPMLSGGNNNSSNNQKNTYSEDLSSYRVSYVVEDKVVTDSAEVAIEQVDSLHYVPVTDSVNMVLDSISSIRFTEDKIRGYTILVYSSMSHEESRKALGILYGLVPEDVKSSLVYNQPYFRVKSGKFFHEIHAYGMLQKIKEEFPSAIIVPETYKISDLTDEQN